MTFVTIRTNIDVELEENIDCYCECGNPICNLVTVKDTDTHRTPRFIITPCPECIESAKDEGRDEGFEKGYEEGKREGYDEGFADCERNSTEKE